MSEIICLWEIDSVLPGSSVEKIAWFSQFGCFFPVNGISRMC